MKPVSSIGTVLSVMLLIAGLSSCAKPEQKPTAKVTDALPNVVVSVNGVKIERAAVLKRLEQTKSMAAHQQHMARMDQAASQGGDQSQAGQPQSTVQSDAAPSSPIVHDPAHSQPDVDDKTMVRNIINQMVMEQLKMQEVERLGLSVSPQLLEANVKHIEEQAGSKESLEEQLRQGHATVEQWRDQLRQALLFQQLAEQRRKAVPVSDQEVREYWDQNRENLSKIWKTKRLEHVQDRIRDLIQQYRWPQTEAEWHNELVRNAKIWVDPAVRQQLGSPEDHSHPEQGNTGQGNGGNPDPGRRG